VERRGSGEYKDKREEEGKEEEGEEEEGEEEHAQLNHIKNVCLDFYIKLLNQTITQSEYNSILVCALAVLGVKENR
jgi:hypothetical protein